MNKKITEELKKILGQTALDDVQILEDGIDIDFQMEYIEFITRYHNEIESLSEDNCYNILQNNDCKYSINERKFALANIARRNTVKAYRAIEQFAKIANPEWKLNQWIKMALRECRSNLEFSLTGKRQVFVSTGLGSKNGKIRYFAVISALQGVKFSPTHQHLIKSELNYSAEKNDSEIEQLDFSESYVSVVILIPFGTEIRNVFMSCIEECNNLGKFLSDDYFVTNVKKYRPEEVEMIVNKANGKYPSEGLPSNTEND